MKTMMSISLATLLLASLALGVQGKHPPYTPKPPRQTVTGQCSTKACVKTITPVVTMTTDADVIPSETFSEEKTYTDPCGPHNSLYWRQTTTSYWAYQTTTYTIDKKGETVVTEVHSMPTTTTRLLCHAPTWSATSTVTSWVTGQASGGIEPSVYIVGTTTMRSVPTGASVISPPDNQSELVTIFLATSYMSMQSGSSTVARVDKVLPQTEAMPTTTHFVKPVLRVMMVGGNTETVGPVLRIPTYAPSSSDAAASLPDGYSKQSANRPSGSRSPQAYSDGNVMTRISSSNQASMAFAPQPYQTNTDQPASRKSRTKPHKKSRSKSHSGDAEASAIDRTTTIHDFVTLTVPTTVVESKSMMVPIVYMTTIRENITTTVPTTLRESVTSMMPIVYSTVVRESTTVMVPTTVATTVREEKTLTLPTTETVREGLTTTLHETHFSQITATVTKPCANCPKGETIYITTFAPSSPQVTASHTDQTMVTIPGARTTITAHELRTTVATNCKGCKTKPQITVITEDVCHTYTAPAVTKVLPKLTNWLIPISLTRVFWFDPAMNSDLTTSTSTTSLDRRDLMASTACHSCSSRPSSTSATVSGVWSISTIYATSYSTVSICPGKNSMCPTPTSTTVETHLVPYTTSLCPVNKPSVESSPSSPLHHSSTRTTRITSTRTTTEKSTIYKTKSHSVHNSFTAFSPTSLQFTSGSAASADIRTSCKACIKAPTTVAATYATDTGMQAPYPSFGTGQSMGGSVTATSSFDEQVVPDSHETMQGQTASISPESVAAAASPVTSALSTTDSKSDVQSTQTTGSLVPAYTGPMYTGASEQNDIGISWVWLAVMIALAI